MESTVLLQKIIWQSDITLAIHAHFGDKLFTKYNGFVLVQQCCLMCQTTYRFKWTIRYHLKWPKKVSLYFFMIQWLQLQSICSLIVDSCSSGSLLQELMNSKQSNGWLNHLINAQIIETVFWFPCRESYSLSGSFCVAWCIWQKGQQSRQMAIYNISVKGFDIVLSNYILISTNSF